MKGCVFFMYFDPNLKCHYRVKKPSAKNECLSVSKLGICMACALLGASALYIAVRSFK